jgi:hypothetical protein
VPRQRDTVYADVAAERYRTSFAPVFLNDTTVAPSLLARQG